MRSGFCLSFTLALRNPSALQSAFVIARSSEEIHSRSDIDTNDIKIIGVMYHVDVDARSVSPGFLQLLQLLQSPQTKLPGFDQLEQIGVQALYYAVFHSLSSPRVFDIDIVTVHCSRKFKEVGFFLDISHEFIQN